MTRQQSPQVVATKKGKPVGLILLFAFIAIGVIGMIAYALTGKVLDIAKVYGQRKGVEATASVNGTSVFSGMIEYAGHRAYSRNILSPKLGRKADCIVWFPDDFDPPSEKTRQWFENWLKDKPGRTLIYVGRDFDAATFYWQNAKLTAPRDQQVEIRRRLLEAKNSFNNQRTSPAKMPTRPVKKPTGPVKKAAKPAKKPVDCNWFAFDSKPAPRKVRALGGDEKWRRDVDPAKLGIELNGRFKPSKEAKVLLESQGDMLVSAQPVWQSQIIVVTNGSFLLNLTLVNHEHRRLAAKLIDEIGPPAKAVVFLESKWSDPPIIDNDLFEGGPSGAEIFCVWPTNWILLQLSAIGIIFCFWRVPIFGPARHPKTEDLSDFGRHIDAVGELLELSGDAIFAHARLQHYHQSTKKADKKTKP